MILGIMEGEDFFLSEEQVELAPGDRLVLYTDGLTDVQAPDGTLFDREQLKAMLAAHSDFSAAKLRDHIFSHLADYQGSADQYDDMTMLVVEVE